MDHDVLNTQALVDAVAERAAGADPLVLLETAVTFSTLAGSAADAMVDHYGAAARSAGLSWTVVGERLGVSKQAARQKYSPRLEAGGGPATEPAAISPRLTRCLEAAQAAADQDGSVPGTQHLLLGLLQVGAAATVLDRLGVTRERILQSSAQLLKGASTSGASGRVVGDGEGRDAVLQARRFAANRGQDQAHPQHLLFVLALDPGSSARRILTDLGVDPARVKKELADLIPPPPQPRRLGRGRRIGKTDPRGRACSFCGCTDAHRAMVNGPGVRICGECVHLAGDIIRTAREGAATDTAAGTLLG